MSKINDLTGKRFGKLEVIRITDLKGDNRSKIWECKCDCGKITFKPSYVLVTGNTKSCGCGKSKFPTTHGLSQHPAMSSYKAMIARCYDEKHIYYYNYGGRGITVCKEWKNDPKKFIEWADENGYKKGLQIDKIDNDGNYSPENCRFVTNRENSRNKRTNRFFTINGETKTMVEWAEIYNVNYKSVSRRIWSGWDIEKAIFTPINKNRDTSKRRKERK